jgi:hypothetical protein
MKPMPVNELVEMWEKDSEIDSTDPGKEILRIPILHSKYVKQHVAHSLTVKSCAIEYARIKKVKWEYYTGKMDKDQLEKYGWEPFPFVLKSEITTYLESDEDINKHIAQKVLHDEIVDVCSSILKELNSRTFQLRDFIQWERFIQGV